MYVYAWSCVCTCVHMPMEARDQYQLSSTITFQPHFITLLFCLCGDLNRSGPHRFVYLND